MASIKDRARQVLRPINSNLQVAIVHQQIFRVAAERSDIVERFGEGSVSFVFLIARETMLMNSVLALMRIWDDAKGASGVPRLLKIMRAEEFKRTLLRERRTTLLDFERGITPQHRDKETLAALKAASEKAAQRTEKDAADELRACIKACEAMKKNDVFQRLDKLRDKLLAHTAYEITEPNNSLPIVRFEDGARLCDATVPIVQGLNMLVEGPHQNFEQFARQWRKRAVAFWEGFAPRR